MTNATRPHPRRDLLLDRLRARLARVTEEDAGPVFEPSALADVRALVEAVPDLEADLQVAREVGWFHWFRLVLGPEGGAAPTIMTTSSVRSRCSRWSIRGTARPSRT